MVCFRFTTLFVVACFTGQAITDLTMMRAVQFTQGGAENLFIGSVPQPQLRPGEVLLRVAATAINRADTLQRMGRYPPPPGASDILGLEAAGVIERVHDDVTTWRAGDKVMALLPGGGNAEFATAHAGHLMRIPEGMAFMDAAAIPEVWLTAFQLLHTLGGLKAGERVLIHAGGSGVGTAAVQLVRLAGAVAIVTAGSQEKIDLAKSLGATEGFNYKEGDFDKKVLDFTEGKGVDVVLDCIGASMWQQNANVLATDGRWVFYGSLGGVEVQGPFLGPIIRKRISLLGTTIRGRSNEYKTDVVDAFTKTALPGFSDGRLKPVVDRVFPLEEIAEAHRWMEGNNNKGKVVLQVAPSGGHQEL